MVRSYSEVTTKSFRRLYRASPVRASRASLGGPATIPADADRDHLVALGVDGGQHVACRYAGHVVLGTAPPEEHDETTAGDHIGIVG